MRSSTLSFWGLGLTVSVLATAGTMPPSGATQPMPTSVKPKQVRLLHLADTHGQLEEHWEWRPDSGRLHRMGGFARLKTMLDERRRFPGAVFAVDGGDTFQGSALAAWTEGEAVLTVLNLLNLDVGIPGNWDVLYGPARFQQLFERVSYHVVCYNFHDEATGRRLFDPAVVLARADVRVAFIGLTDPTTTDRQAPAQVMGLDSTRTTGLRDFVRALRRHEQPDLVVLVDHTGLLPSVQWARRIPELDVVLSGHTHERVYEPIRIGRTLVVEPGAFGSFVGQLDLTVQDRRITDSRFELVPIDAEHFDEDPSVRRVIHAVRAPYTDRLDAVIGRTATVLMRDDVIESPMDNLIADAVRAATRSDIAFTNGFRFAPPIAPGLLTEADLWNMLPFDAGLKSGLVTGAQLLQYLENELEQVFAEDPESLSGGWGPRPSGLSMTFTAKAGAGERLRDVTVGGRPLERDRAYRLGGCHREGEPLSTMCRLEGVEEAREEAGSLHQALRAYLAGHSPITMTREGRARALDLPETVPSQFAALQRLWDLPGEAEAVEPAPRSAFSPH